MNRELDLTEAGILPMRELMGSMPTVQHVQKKGSHCHIVSAAP